MPAPGLHTDEDLERHDLPFAFFPGATAIIRDHDRALVRHGFKQQAEDVSFKRMGDVVMLELEAAFQHFVFSVDQVAADHACYARFREEGDRVRPCGKIVGRRSAVQNVAALLFGC